MAGEHGSGVGPNSVDEIAPTCDARSNRHRASRSRSTHRPSRRLYDASTQAVRSTRCCLNNFIGASANTIWSRETGLNCAGFAGQSSLARSVLDELSTSFAGEEGDHSSSPVPWSLGERRLTAVLRRACGSSGGGRERMARSRQAVGDPRCDLRDLLDELVKEIALHP